MKNEQSRISSRGWVKKALCAGVIMGMSMMAGMSFAGEKPKDDNGNIMTPFARIAHIQVVKDEYDNIDREATYKKARAVAVAIANYLANVDDAVELSIRILKEKGLLESGDYVIHVASTPMHISHKTNMLKVTKVN